MDNRRLLEARLPGGRTQFVGTVEASRELPISWPHVPTIVLGSHTSNIPRDDLGWYLYSLLNVKSSSNSVCYTGQNRYEPLVSALDLQAKGSITRCKGYTFRMMMISLKVPTRTVSPVSVYGVSLGGGVALTILPFSPKSIYFSRRVTQQPSSSFNRGIPELRRPDSGTFCWQAQRRFPEPWEGPQDWNPQFWTLLLLRCRL